MSVSTYLIFLKEYVSNPHIGGQKFATSKATLLEFKGSLFEALVMSDHSQTNSDATYCPSMPVLLILLTLLSRFFIDRDPKYFPAVLNFMRDGKFRNSDIKSVDLEELTEEFEFFNIPFPHHQVSLCLQFI